MVPTIGIFLQKYVKFNIRFELILVSYGVSNNFYIFSQINVNFVDHIALLKDATPIHPVLSVVPKKAANNFFYEKQEPIGLCFI